VTEHSILTERKDRRHPSSLPRDEPVPDSKDTRVKRVQALGAKPPADRRLLKPKPFELSPRDHPMLPTRQLSDRRVPPPMRLPFRAHIA